MSGASVPPVALRRLTLAGARDAGFAGQAAALLRQLVAAGAALGWVEPPPPGEVADFLAETAAADERGDACLVAAWAGTELAGLGNWRRYPRPTHRVNGDVQKLAVASGQQGRGVGRLLISELIASAAAAGVETLTVDFRGDNERAARLYSSVGFTEYGRLPGFVAFGPARYDRVMYSLDLRSDAAGSR
ncbi:MAG: GNAT family N-acetyltransferase [Nocardiopsaceae bacterium]|jgi:ribosomal protein S18 acetylase RimI-like enzyme|nr:GNAT family N-acetyltransferase [Nocardiopsaceae bacterium]